MSVRSTGARPLVGALVAGVAWAVLAVGASPVAAASPCAPGQPPGRPPGTPAGAPGQPASRPPQYPPGQCQLRLSAAAGAPGAVVAAAGDGFAPGSTVRLVLQGRPLASATADGAGQLTASFVVPADAAPGPVAVQAVGVDGTGAPHVLSAAFTVLAAPSGGDAGAPAAVAGRLVATGASSTKPLVGAGVGLLAVGLVATRIGRRRRGDSSP